MIHPALIFSLVLTAMARIFPLANCKDYFRLFVEYAGIAPAEIFHQRMGLATGWRRAPLY